MTKTNPSLVIPLTKGQSTIVDIEDAELIYLSWRAAYCEAAKRLFGEFFPKPESKE